MTATGATMRMIARRKYQNAVPGVLPSDLTDGKMSVD